MARKDKTSQQTPSLFSFDTAPTQAPGQASAQAPGQADAGMASRRSNKLVPGQEARSKSDEQGMSVFAQPSEDRAVGPAYTYRKVRFRKGDEVSVYNEQMDARFAMDPRSRTLLILTIAVIILIPLFVVTPTGWLTADGLANGLAGWIDTFQSNLRALGNWISGVPDGNGISIVFYQTLIVAIIGAALATNGAIYQGAMKNALASPSTLGVMSGGTLGTVIYLLVFMMPETGDLLETGVEVTTASEVIAQFQDMSIPEYILTTQLRSLCSVVGCFVVVGLVLLIAYIAGKGKVSKSALIISGQVFSAVISGAIGVVRTYLTLYGTEAQVEAIRMSVGGSVNYVTNIVDVALIAIPLIIGFIIVMRLRFKLNLLAFGDEEARSLGISVNFTRNAVMIVCTIMTAVVVSFCGNVGFVGFLVPHVARKFVGPDLRYLVPASALVGSVYLLISNYVMSLGNILSSSLGTFTSLIGVIFFIVALVSQRRQGNADWV
ncbi:MAG: iron ABC transporter permease [Eggerthellaceae bacterium]|nr:iron ABC transporter permease [Eggerthellaceae bacterium]